jgi:hypothetical protein
MAKRKPKKILPEIKVALTRCAGRQRAVPLNYPDNLGLRTKLGGKPDWIQGPEIPYCTQCKSSLTFIAQIDSIEHESETNPLSIPARGGKQDYMFGDVGMIYVFLCFYCNAPYAVHQSY